MAKHRRQRTRKYGDADNDTGRDDGRFIVRHGLSTSSSSSSRCDAVLLTLTRRHVAPLSFEGGAKTRMGAARGHRARSINQSAMSRTKESRAPTREETDVVRQSIALVCSHSLIIPALPPPPPSLSIVSRNSPHVEFETLAYETPISRIDRR